MLPVLWSAMTACAPALTDETPYLTSPRILAAQAEPPEAEPDEVVSLSVLAADASGELPEPEIGWSFCASPKPLAELGPVAPSCLEQGSEDLLFIGDGAATQATIPTETCSLFGPNPPPPQEGQPPGRPADPDATGGFYQPVIASLQGGEMSLAAVRIRCGIANVSQETYIAWNQGYLSNSNPSVAEMRLGRANGEEIPLLPAGDGEPAEVSLGEELSLVVSWPQCPDLPDSCPGAERYIVYDPDLGTLIERREGISVSWYTTAGRFADARGGRDGDDPETRVENTIVAPEEPGELFLAVVLRDERGGVGFETYRISVTP